MFTNDVNHWGLSYVPGEKLNFWQYVTPSASNIRHVLGLSVYIKLLYISTRSQHEVLVVVCVCVWDYVSMRVCVCASAWRGTNRGPQYIIGEISFSANSHTHAHKHPPTQTIIQPPPTHHTLKGPRFFRSVDGNKGMLVV